MVHMDFGLRRNDEKGKENPRTSAGTFIGENDLSVEPGHTINHGVFASEIHQSRLADLIPVCAQFLHRLRWTAIFDIVSHKALIHMSQESRREGHPRTAQAHIDQHPRNDLIPRSQAYQP